MLQRKDTFLLYSLGIIMLVGALKSFIIPLMLSIADPVSFNESPMNYMVNSIVHGFTISAWMTIMMRPESLARREERSLWTLYGLIIIIMGAIVPNVWSISVNLQDTSLVEALISRVTEASETTFYAVSYGCGFALFNLESHRRFMRLHIPLGILWIVGPLPMSLFYHMGFPFEGVLEGPHLFQPQVGPPIWVFPHALFDAWFWADQILDYPLAAIILRANWRLRKGAS